MPWIALRHAHTQTQTNIESSPAQSSATEQHGLNTDKAMFVRVLSVFIRGSDLDCSKEASQSLATEQHGLNTDRKCCPWFIRVHPWLRSGWLQGGIPILSHGTTRIKHG